MTVTQPDCSCSCHLPAGGGTWRFGHSQTEGCSICTDWIKGSGTLAALFEKWHNGRVIAQSQPSYVDDEVM